MIMIMIMIMNNFEWNVHDLSTGNDHEHCHWIRS